MTNGKKEFGMRNRVIAGLFLVLTLATVACSSEADIASSNISTSADQFEIYRRVVFFNGITDSYLLTIEGLCSLGNHDSERELSVTCKVGPSEYKKHFLGLSERVLLRGAVAGGDSERLPLPGHLPTHCDHPQC